MNKNLIKNEGNNDIKSGKNILKKNLKNFEHFSPSIFNTFKNYTPNKIQYKKDSNDQINLFDTEYNEFIYQNPIQDSIAQAHHFFKSPTRFIYEAKTEGSLDNPRFIHTFHLSRCNRIIQENNGFFSCTPPQHEIIPSLILVGIGLGYHLETLCNEHNINHLFIYEPDPDIFYAAMQTINFEPLLKLFSKKTKSITLTVGGACNDFINNIYFSFLRIGYFYATKLYLYRHFNTDESKYIDEKLNEVIHRMYLGWGFYEDELISISHTIHNLEKPMRFIKEKSTKNLSTRENLSNIENLLILDNLLVMIIGNGPSLDESAEFIKKNQEKFIIFSCGSTLTSLYQYGITPDFHVEVERTKDVFDWLKNIDDLNYTKKIKLLGFNNLYPHSIDLFGTFIAGLKSNDAGQQLLSQCDQQLKVFNHGNPTAVNAAVAHAIELGFKKIVLFGVDMGFKNATYHHSKKSAYFQADSTFFTNEIQADRCIPGNFCDHIHTNQALDYSRFALENQLKEASDVTCFNCSDGAKIANTTTLSAEILEMPPSENQKEAFILSLVESRTMQCQKKDKKIFENHYSALRLQIKEIIHHLKQYLLISSENIEEMILCFDSQIKYLAEKSKNNPLISTMLAGSIHYMQTTIFSIMLDVYKKDDFQRLSSYFFYIFLDYLDDMLKITENNHLSLDKEINIHSFIQRYNKNV